MELDRNGNESELDYHKRLIYGKLVDRTLSEYDYSELAERLYGREYSSDVARRMMYGSRKTLELLDHESIKTISSDSIMNEIEVQRAELQKERQRFFDQRREYGKLVSSQGRAEHLYECLARAADNLETSVGRLYDDADRECKLFAGQNDAILVFSDWHYGMTTSNVFNTFNKDICVSRVCRVVQEAERRIMSHGCAALHVVILGDLFHGAIHTSARVASEEVVCDQIMQVSEILAQSIEELSRHVGHTVVHMTYGNHARTVQDKSDSLHDDNMEKLIPWWMAQRFKGRDDIEISDDADNEFVFIESFGHQFCATHGDLDNVKNSPRLLATLFQKKYGKDIEYILLGDKHHRESFEELGITSMLCGSLCGADGYANDKRLFSTPSQILLIVNRECGVDAEYRIRCE